MNERLTLSRLYMIITNLNVVIITFFILLFTTTIYKYADSHQAIVFLSGMNAIPTDPWKLPVFVGGGFGLLLVILHIKRRSPLMSDHMFLLLMIELLLCFVIIKGLYFQYNGVLLLVITEFLMSNHKSKDKFLVLGLCVIIYVLTTVEVVPVKNAVNLELFFAYYSVDIRGWMKAIISILISLNNFVFMMHLIWVIRFQITENERVLKLNQQLDDANDQLVNANLKLKEYAKTSEKMAQTKERNRLAREIHDTLGHTLTGINAGLDAIKVLMGINLKEADRQLDGISQLARNGIRDVRRSVKALRPDALERLSLEDAIQDVCKDYKKLAETTVVFRGEGLFHHMDMDEEDAVYRLVQESMTNAVRHGKATHIHIDISRHENQLSITIQDNGIGCEVIKEGFGLIHMRERIGMLSGELSYEATDGFKVTAIIPIRWGEHG